MLLLKNAARDGHRWAFSDVCFVKVEVRNHRAFHLVLLADDVCNFPPEFRRGRGCIRVLKIRSDDRHLLLLRRILI